MVGLRVDGRPLLRAYRIVSANYEEQLEFLSIKVPDGPLTSRLQHIKPRGQNCGWSQAHGARCLSTICCPASGFIYWEVAPGWPHS
jgi:ferredoxin-NADP reductase